MGTYISGLKFFTGASNIRIGKAIPANILVQPVGKIIDQGESHRLYTEVSGTRPFAYQWFRNGVPVVDATSNILNVQNATYIDDGLYYCAVTNVLDTVKTNTVSLKVLTPITITQQPSTTFVQPNSIATFFIDYIGGGTIYIDWYFNNRRLLSYNKTLSVFNVTTSDIGEYYCILTNEKGSVTSNKANLNYIYPIEVTKHPENTKIIPDGSLTLTCEITGAYPATYFWRKNGVQILNTTKTLTDVSDLTCRYTAPLVNKSFEGDYDCVITNITRVSAISNIAKVVLDETINLNSNAGNNLYITTIKNSNVVTIDQKWVDLGQNTKNISTGTRIFNPDIKQILSDKGPINSATSQPSYISSLSIINSIVDQRTFKINIPALSTGNSIANLADSVIINQITTTKDSDIVTVTSTNGLLVGMTINGPNIPKGAIITEIINGTTIRISINATDSGVVNDVSVKVEDITTLTNITVLKGSNIITVPSTIGLYIGMKITNSAFPDGTVITKINDDGTIEVSNNSTDDVFNTTVNTTTQKTLENISTTKDSKVVTVKSTEGLLVGTKVSGTGIPDGAIVTKILGPTSFEIDLPATVTTLNGSVLLDTIFKLFISTTINSTTISANSTSKILACTKLVATGIPDDARITEIVNETQFKISKPATETTANQLATTEIVENTIISKVTTTVDSDIVTVPCTVGLIVGAEIVAPNIPDGSVIIKIIDSTTIQISKKAVISSETNNATTKVTNPIYYDGKLYQGYPITREVGENIQFSIKVSSLNEMAYQWMKGNVGRIDDQTNSSYYISDMKQSDSGEYYCVIIDEFSNINTSTAVLNVTSNYVTLGGEDYLVFDDNVYWKI